MRKSNEQGNAQPNTIAGRIDLLRQDLSALALTIEGEVALHTLGSDDYGALMDAKEQLNLLAAECSDTAKSIPTSQTPSGMYINPERLFQSIVPLRVIPKVTPPVDQAQVPITITRDRYVIVGENVRHVYGTPLCVFNSLLLTRDRWMSGGTLRSIGYDWRTPRHSSSYSSSFARAMNTIVDWYGDTGAPVVETYMERREKFYRLSEAIVLQDFRAGSQ